VSTTSGRAERQRYGLCIRRMRWRSAHPLGLGDGERADSGGIWESGICAAMPRHDNLLASLRRSSVEDLESKDVHASLACTPR